MNKHVSLGFQFEGLPRLHPAAESLTHVFHLDVAFQKPGKVISSFFARNTKGMLYPAPLEFPQGPRTWMNGKPGFWGPCASSMRPLRGPNFFYPAVHLRKLHVIF